MGIALKVDHHKGVVRQAFDVKSKLETAFRSHRDTQQELSTASERLQKLHQTSLSDDKTRREGGWGQKGLLHKETRLLPGSLR
ncbi:hypothetical protein, partial [Grimontia celer]|uniref:hypothetical protein n=1 Tax=Grimontia celer TaxID=1796497 RepID=UPI001E3BE709